MSPNLYRRMKSPVRRVLELSPTLYCASARLKRSRNRNIVSRNSDLLVESFPRSGTTYFVASLGIAAPTLRIASHLHHQAHVELAVRKSVPSFVLIREPFAACISATVRLGDQVTFPQMLQRWSGFYEALESVPEVHFVSFESTVQEPEATILAVLSAANLSERLRNRVDHDEVIAVLDAMTEKRRRGNYDPLDVSRPTAERQERIEAVASEMRQQGGELLTRAIAIHERIQAL